MVSLASGNGSTSPHDGALIVSFVVAILAFVVLVIAVIFGAMWLFVSSERKRKETLRTTGVRADARVVLAESARRSGSDRYHIVLEVHPEGQPPVTTQVEVSISLETLARLAPGAIVPVRHAPHNAREVVIDLPDVR
jgi:hypothetical protein